MICSKTWETGCLYTVYLPKDSINFYTKLCISKHKALLLNTMMQKGCWKERTLLIYICYFRYKQNKKKFNEKKKAQIGLIIPMITIIKKLGINLSFCVFPPRLWWVFEMFLHKRNSFISLISQHLSSK